MNDEQIYQDARKILALLHRRRGIILTSLFVCLVGAFLYNYTTRPLYQATTQILISEGPPKVLANQDLVQASMQDYQTEYALIASRGLAERVVERLDLQGNPELRAGPLMSPWERFQRRFLGKPAAPVVDSDGIPLSPAAAALRSRLSVQPLPGGRLVNLRINAYDPGLAAEIANAWAQLYIEQSLELRYNTSNEAAAWLEQRVADQKQRLAEAEQALFAHRDAHGVTSTAERTEAAESGAAALARARAEMAERETQLAQLRALSPDRAATSPLVMQSGLVQALRAQIAEAEAEHAELGKTLGERHPQMQQLRDTIAEAQSKIDAEVRNIRASLEAGYEAARLKVQALEDRRGEARGSDVDSGRSSAQLAALESEVETQRGVLAALMSRTQEADLQSELDSSNIRIIERAEVPRGPVSPRKTRNYQVALLLGLALGVGLSLLFEHLDNTLKTPEDIKEHLGLPFLGMVPEVGAKQERRRQPKPSPLILKNPQSAVAEAYRVLRTNLIFSTAQMTGRVILVTSANPGEGKTTTVANLASSLAINGARVLAVDADLRRPTMHLHFGVSKTPGLSDLIVGKVQASKAIQSTRFKGLQVLPCGYVPPNPAELLGSDNMKEILGAFRSHYDWVLIDTPPVLAMADTPVMSRLVDGAVLVVGAEQSGRPAVERAVDSLTGVGGHITGVVLNKVDLERNSYYYGQYYGEYYRSYYSEAGSPRSGGKATGRRRPPVARA